MRSAAVICPDIIDGFADLLRAFAIFDCTVAACLGGTLPLPSSELA